MRPGAIVRFAGQPEAGAWRVITCDQRARRIHLRQADGAELRTVTLGGLQLESFPLLPGMTVKIVAGANVPVAATIVDVAPANEQLRHCRLRLSDATEVEYDESALVPLVPSEQQPIALIAALRWRGPTAFYARLNLHQQLATWFEETDGLPSLAGARVQALGHQISAATRVLRDRQPRFVLADEVGLGKTIEAGYVIQALLAADPKLRCLIITPGAMARQWLMELYLRFGSRAFHLVDESAPNEELEDTWHNERLVIVSATTLLARPIARSGLDDATWDLVVIDEAHNYARTHPLFPTLRAASRNARGLLALSATPSKRELDGLLAVLELVSPETYADLTPERLREALREREPIWRALSTTVDLHKASEGDISSEHLEALAEAVWDGVLVDDPVVQGLRANMREGSVDAVEQLIAYVQEFHRIDHRIIRTRRRTLASFGDAWPDRTSELVRYDASDPELLLFDHLRRWPAAGDASESQKALRVLLETAAASSPARLEEVLEARLEALTQAAVDPAFDALAALCADPGGDEERTILDHIVRSAAPCPDERIWLEEAQALTEQWSNSAIARFDSATSWIKRHLAESRGAKVLVFSQFGRTVEAFCQHIEGQLPSNGVRSFTYSAERKELEAAAQAFQSDPKCRVLVSDELGGEGRNFQIASAVVHLDHPLSVSRIEQRIGRLDRLGREVDRAVLSVIIAGPGETETELLRVHSEVFGVYERSVGGLEFLLPEVHRELVTAVGRSAAAVAEGREIWRTRVTETLEAVDRDFEYMLDSTRPDLERARETAALIADAGSDLEAAAAIRLRFQTAARKLGISFRELREPAESATLSWAEDLSLPGFVRGEHRYTGTFSREVALDNESVQFFGPGHALVDGLFAVLRESSHGRTAVFGRKLGEAHRGKCFVVLVFACEVRVRGGDAGLVTRARRYLWPEWKTVTVELNANAPERSEIVGRGRLLDDLVREPNASEHGLPPDALGSGLPRLIRGIEHASKLAIDVVRREREKLRAQAATKLRAELALDRGYLAWRLGRAAGDEAASLRAELEQLEAVVAAVDGEAVTLDSLAVIVGA